MGWFEDLTPGATLTAATRENVVKAMLAFSDHQRDVMIRAGVRIWAEQGLPPELLATRTEIIHTTPGNSRYVRQMRVVHLFGTPNYLDIRHELAHCWDHVRRGNVRSLAGLSGDALSAAVNRSPPLTLSNSDRVVRFLDFYRRRLARLGPGRRLRPRCRPEVLLDKPYDLGGWDFSSENATEFYAECYRCFHAPSKEPWAALDQARLWLYAREMYNLLEHESRSERSPLPDPAAIQAEILRYCLPDAPPIH